MIYLLDIGCKFIEKIGREYASFNAGQMKLTPTLVLLLNTLLYGNNLQQIFISNYWHALPAAICNIGVAIYLERHPEVQRCFNQFLKNDLAKVVSEALILWAVLTATSFTWMLTQGAIYRSVRIMLTKFTPSPPAPLAIMWQPELTWREFTVNNSDSISLAVAIVMSSFVLLVGLISKHNYLDSLAGTFSWISSTRYPQFFTFPWELVPKGRGERMRQVEADMAADALWSWEAMKPGRWMLSGLQAPLPDFIPQARNEDDAPAAHCHLRSSSPAPQDYSEWEPFCPSARQPSPALSPWPFVPAGLSGLATPRYSPPAAPDAFRRESPMRRRQASEGRRPAEGRPAARPAAPQDAANAIAMLYDHLQRQFEK